MGWFYRHFRLNRNESLLTLNNNLTVNGALTGATVSDSTGSLGRRYIVESSEIDLSGTTATIVLCRIPEAATLIKAQYVVTEAFGSTSAGGKIQIGHAGADGTTGADVDAYVTGATGAANGAIAGTKALGLVQNLTLAATSVAGGKCLTATHTALTAGSTGKIVVIVEYMM